MACLAAAIGAWAIAARAQPAPASATLLRAGRLLDVRAGVYRLDQGIWIEGGRIRQVGAFEAVKSSAPAAASALDLSRAAVLPGLVDVHAHLLAAMDPERSSTDDLILTLAKDPPAKRALLGAAMAREVLDAGFTTVRNLGHSGVDGDVSLRDAIRSGWVPGPRIVAAGRKIAPPGGQALPTQSAVLQTLLEQDFLIAGTPDEGRRAVLENIRVGADVIKVVADDERRVMEQEVLQAIVAEAHRASLKVTVHATGKLAIDESIAAGVDSIEHGDEGTEDQFRAMRDKGIVLVPTLWPRELLPIPRPFSERPDVEALKDRYVAGQRAKLDRARRAGVKVVFGSDAWFRYAGRTRGEATRTLLEAMHGFGLSPADTLRAGTIDAAALLGMNDAGAIEAGRLADVIAVDGDPLADVADLDKISFVMKGGVVVRAR